MLFRKLYRNGKFIGYLKNYAMAYAAGDSWVAYWTVTGKPKVVKNCRLQRIYKETEVVYAIDK